MKLFELIERMRDLSTSHKYVKSFHTGKQHEVNKRLITYPAVFMSFPYTKNTPQGFGVNDYVRYSFDVDIVTNQYYGFDLTGTTSADTFNTNYMISSDIDENVGFKDENKLRETALAIGQHILSKIIEDDFSTIGYDLNLINYQIKSLERVNNDYVTGIRLRMEVETVNDYQCEFESFFHSPTPPDICKSLEFDGINDVINCTNNSVFDFGIGNAYSIETWVKFDNLTGFRFLVSKWLTVLPADAKAYFLGTNGDKLTFRMFAGNSTSLIIDSNISLLVGQWYHLVCTYDGSTNASGSNLYINSVSDKNIINDNLSGNILNTEPLQIGGQATFYSAAKIGKVRMWNLELTPSDVITLYNGGTILNTPVESGNLVLDTDIPNSTFSTQWAVPDLTSITTGYSSENMESDDLIDDCPPNPINLCKSLDFDGINDSIDCSNNSAFDFKPTDSFSFETWVKFDVTTGANVLVGKLDPAIPNGYYFGVVDSEVRMFLRSGSSTILNMETTTTISTGVWYHLVGTYNGNQDASGVKIYINDSLSLLTTNLNTLTATGMVNTEPLQIGVTNTFYSDAKIAKVRVWNTELTASEVTTMFNGGVIQNSPVQSGSLVVDTDIPNSTFSTQWLVPDLTSITTGYNSISMDSDDLIDDCPPT